MEKNFKRVMYVVFGICVLLAAWMYFKQLVPATAVVAIIVVPALVLAGIYVYEAFKSRKSEGASHKSDEGTSSEDSEGKSKDGTGSEEPDDDINSLDKTVKRLLEAHNTYQNAKKGLSEASGRYKDILKMLEEAERVADESTSGEAGEGKSGDGKPSDGKPGDGA